MSLRARLRERSRPSVTFSLRVDDDTQARAELAEAVAEGDEERIAHAQAAVNACYEQLRITALAPTDWEALVAAHPPSEEQREKGAWCNQPTFLPALLAECIDSDVTAADWAEYTTKGPMSSGEAQELIDVVMGINLRTPDGVTGKG